MRLSKNEWVILGVEFKSLKKTLRERLEEIRDATSSKNPLVRKFQAAIRKIDSVISDLDDIMCEQFRGWEDATNVFYGEEDQEV